MPPRGGNHRIKGCLSVFLKVSTHAPARGQSRNKRYIKARTICFNSCPREGAIIRRRADSLRRTPVSTHAPVRGQSAARGMMLKSRASFNSCPREGAIIISFDISDVCFNVSTHAPARGQSDRVNHRNGCNMFQLMPPRGGNHQCIFSYDGAE